MAFVHVSFAPHTQLGGPVIQGGKGIFRIETCALDGTREGARERDKSNATRERIQKRPVGRGGGLSVAHAV